MNFSEEGMERIYTINKVIIKNYELIMIWPIAWFLEHQ